MTIHERDTGGTMSTHPPGAAAKLRDRLAVIEEQSEWGRTERAEAAEPLIAALPDIIAVIAAAEKLTEKREGWGRYCAGGDQTCETCVGSCGIEEHEETGRALAVLNARLTDTRDGGEA